MFFQSILTREVRMDWIILIVTCLAMLSGFYPMKKIDEFIMEQDMLMQEEEAQ